MEERAVRVILEPWEYRRACDVGIGRIAANWGKPNAVHYDRARMEDDRSADVAAAICELAVAKATNRYWHGHVWNRADHAKYRNAPDVGTNIEVRRVRTRDAVAVRRSDAGKVVFAARAIAPEFTEVEVLGYVKADDALLECPDGESWFYWPVSRLIGISAPAPPQAGRVGAISDAV